VDLSDNGIAHDGISYLIEGILSNQTMISLNLSQNDLGHNLQVVEKLMEIFHVNQHNPEPSLEELNLSNNLLSNKALKCLSSALI